jgi:hypothetical protein
MYTNDNGKNSNTVSPRTINNRSQNRDSSEIAHAHSTYLNVTGPGEYTLPSLTATSRIF